MTKGKKTENAAVAAFFDGQIRYFTQQSLDGAAIQRRLQTASILLVGAGTIGAHTLLSLADAGFEKITLLDAAEVTEADLHANPLLKHADLKRSRAEATLANLSHFHYPALKLHHHSTLPLSDAGWQEFIKKFELLIVCLDAPAPALVDSINRAALAVKLDWLAGQIYQGVALIGPFIKPGQTPCYQCYQYRRNANLSNYEEIMQYETRLRELPAIKREFIAPRPLAGLIASVLAMEAMRAIGGVAVPQLYNRIMRADLITSEFSYHRILRMPGCPDCGKHKLR